MSRLERAWRRALVDIVWEELDADDAGELLALGRWGYAPEPASAVRLRQRALVDSDGQLTELGRAVYVHGRQRVGR